MKKRVPELSDLTLCIEPGESYVLLSSGERALDHLLNIFTGAEKVYRDSGNGRGGYSRR